MHRINEGPIELFNNRLRPTSEIPSGPTNRRATSRTESRLPLIKPGTDLHNKIRIIEEKNRNYAFQATNTRDKQNQMEIVEIQEKLNFSRRGVVQDPQRALL